MTFWKYFVSLVTKCKTKCKKEICSTKHCLVSNLGWLWATGYLIGPVHKSPPKMINSFCSLAVASGYKCGISSSSKTLKRMGGLENADKSSEASLRNPRRKRKQRPPNKPKNAKKRKPNATHNHNAHNPTNGSENNASEALPLEPFSFFLDEFQTANGVQVSSLEFESMKDTLLIWIIFL